MFQKLKTFFVVLTVFALFAIFSVCAFAVNETEDNGNYNNANTVSVNDVVIGELDGASDVDYFKFTVENDGYFQFFLTHKYYDSGTYFDIKLMSSDKERMLRYRTTPTSTDTQSYKCGIPAGTYYVVVDSDSNSVAFDLPDIVYSLKLSFVENEDWETENNDNYSVADNIQVNRSVTGVMQSNPDYYKFTLNSDGYIYLDLEHAYKEGSTYFDIYIRSYDGSSYTDYLRFRSAPTATSPVSKKCGLPAGTYYVLVSYDTNYVAFDLGGTEYKFTVNFTTSDIWETEKNNNLSQADNVDIGKRYFASITSSDKDYFRFKINGKKNISVTANHEYSDENQTFFNIDIIKYDGTSESKINSLASKGSSDTVKTKTVTLDSGEYYLRFSGSSLSGDYNFTINEENTPTKNTVALTNETGTKGTTKIADGKEIFDELSDESIFATTESETEAENIYGNTESENNSSDAPGDNSSHSVHLILIAIIFVLICALSATIIFFVKQKKNNL